MNKDTYLTLKTSSEGIFKDRGSKFFAFAFPVDSEDEIAMRLESIKKSYHDARHHCYAYRLGRNGDIYRANDDGEPNHSAGDPILGQLKSADVSDALIIVVRYFGGTKLGVGGLINAYRSAASEAIDNNTIIEKVLTRNITVKFPYSDTDPIMRIVKKFDLEILEQAFEIESKIKLKIRENDLDEVIGLLSNYGTVELVN